MNEEVYNNLYSNYNSVISEVRNSRGLYTGKGIAYAHQMVDVRKELEWGGLDDCDIGMTNEGFEFIGEPKTPPRYWEKLIGDMSEAEMDQKRSLQSMVV